MATFWAGYEGWGTSMVVLPKSDTARISSLLPMRFTAETAHSGIDRNPRVKIVFIKIGSNYRQGGITKSAHCCITSRLRSIMSERW